MTRFTFLATAGITVLCLLAVPTPAQAEEVQTEKAQTAEKARAAEEAQARAAGAQTGKAQAQNVQTSSFGAASLSASVSIPSASYTGAGCMDIPVTMYVSGGTSNGFNYWVTDNETLTGPTSFPIPAHFYFDNEEAPGQTTMQVCPLFDHAGTYTYSADVRYETYNTTSYGHVYATFSLQLAQTAFTRLGGRKWRLVIVGQPYTVAYPEIILQKKRHGRYRGFGSGFADSGGLFRTRGGAGRYQLIFNGNEDRGLASTSLLFRRR